MSGCLAFQDERIVRRIGLSTSLRGSLTSSESRCDSLAEQLRYGRIVIRYTSGREGAVMRAAGRFVVDVHGHITTLYQPAPGVEADENWDGLSGEVEPVYNTDLTFYDMERYGVDMLLLKPSMVGTTNESQAKLVDMYPDKFRAFCADQTLKLRVSRGEAKWTLEAAAEEVEAALKTGKYIGIGEFVPARHQPGQGLHLRRAPRRVPRLRGAGAPVQGHAGLPRLRLAPGLRLLRPARAHRHRVPRRADHLQPRGLLDRRVRARPRTGAPRLRDRRPLCGHRGQQRVPGVRYVAGRVLHLRRRRPQRHRHPAALGRRLRPRAADIRS